MKIAVLGATGQLGTDCVAALRASGHEVLALAHEDADIADAEAVGRALGSFAPDAVVNAAAFHNVDRCEREPERAFLVNAVAPRGLARLSNDLGFRLVHISTDYVFDGTKGAPYVESDEPRPINVYGNSKLSGELFVRAIARRHCVVRVSAIYGLNPCRAKGGANFVTTMLRLAREKGEARVVDDEFVSPTWTADIARQLPALLTRDDNGVVHAASRGACSWHDFARAIFDISRTPARLERAASSDFPARTPRPRFSALDNARLRGWGIDLMPPWRAALERYLGCHTLTF